MTLDLADAAGVLVLALGDPLLKPVGKVEGEPVAFPAGEELVFPLLAFWRHGPLRLAAFTRSP
jgi:hypothetical protein